MNQSLNQYHLPSRQRLSFWMVLLAVLFHVGHSFDVCASHIGLRHTDSGAPTAAPNANSSCPLLNHAACVHDVQPDKQHEDGCESTSEIAIRSSQNSIQPATTTLILLPVAVSPQTPQLILLVGALYGRDGPPDVHRSSQTSSSPLSGRAPPLSL